MVNGFMKKLKNEYPRGETKYISIPLMKLFELSEKKDNRITPELIESFCKVDDTDIVYTLKIQGDNSDKVLQYLSDSILNRVLFKVALQNEPHLRKKHGVFFLCSLLGVVQVLLRESFLFFLA